jgi:hypothetical protein
LPPPSPSYFSVPNFKERVACRSFKRLKSLAQRRDEPPRNGARGRQPGGAYATSERSGGGD